MSDFRLALRSGTALAAVALLAGACSDSRPGGSSSAPQVPSASVPSAADEAPSGDLERDFAAALREVPPGQFDPLSVPMGNGIAWYGTWEDAVAEVRRTGKPLMLHMGSPRCPNGTVCVPGTW